MQVSFCFHTRSSKTITITSDPSSEFLEVSPSCCLKHVTFVIMRSKTRVSQSLLYFLACRGICTIHVILDKKLTHIRMFLFTISIFSTGPKTVIMVAVPPELLKKQSFIVKKHAAISLSSGHKRMSNNRCFLFQCISESTQFDANNGLENTSLFLFLAPIFSARPTTRMTSQFEFLETIP